MGILQQVRTQAPQPVKTADITGVLDSIMTAAGSVMGPAMKVAYFLVLLVILWRVGVAVAKKETGKISLMDWIALGIMFGLMCG